MSQDSSAEVIRQTVREHYGAIARTQSTATETCCAPTAACACNSLYAAEQTAELPDPVTALSLGCGNPVAVADLRPGETVLDLGAGGGIDCFLAAKQVGETGRVIGVDMTPEMVAQARQNAARVNAPQVEFREGLLEKLPVADATVDVIISNCVINLTPDKFQAFTEMYRVLRPGGRVVVSDVVTRGPMSPLVAKDLEAWAGCVSGALPVEDYQREMQAAGFREIEINPLPGTPASALAQAPGLPFSAIITARKSK